MRSPRHSSVIYRKGCGWTLADAPLEPRPRLRRPALTLAPRERGAKARWPGPEGVGKLL